MAGRDKAWLGSLPRGEAITLSRALFIEGLALYYIMVWSLLSAYHCPAKSCLTPCFYPHFKVYNFSEVINLVFICINCNRHSLENRLWFFFPFVFKNLSHPLNKPGWSEGCVNKFWKTSGVLFWERKPYYLHWSRLCSGIMVYLNCRAPTGFSHEKGKKNTWATQKDIHTLHWRIEKKKR